MTAPDAAPTAEDVIAEAVEVEIRKYPAPDRLSGAIGWGATPRTVSAAVVAAVRAMSVEQKAELIGGEIERQARLSSGKPIPLSTPLGLQTAERLGRPIESRVVGPWQVTP